MAGHFYFEIQADDPKRAIEFYKDIFDWKFNKAEDLHVEYYRIQAGDIGGGLLKRPAKTPPPQHGTNAFVCSMEVDNFDSTAEKIVKAGGQIAFPKFAIPGKCWQGYFVDTEGNTFGIFEVDKSAK